MAENQKDAVTASFEQIDAKAVFEAGRALAQWWRKTATILARPAHPGELVETVVDGKSETSNVAAEGYFVVQNPSGKQYIVSGAKFAEKYESEADALDERGFQKYRAISRPVQCVMLTRDVEFKAPWGETMRIARGGRLVNAGGEDVYGVQPQAFKETYSRCYPDGKLIDPATWNSAYALACQDAYDAFQHWRARRTDAEVETNALRAIDASLIAAYSAV